MLARFEGLARKRRATRHFLQQPLERKLIERLLLHGPMGTERLQPSADALRRRRRSHDPFTHPAGMHESTIRERGAPRDRVRRRSPGIGPIRGDAGVRSREAALSPRNMPAFSVRWYPLMFRQGPLGLNWFWKATLIPLARVFVPIPQMMAVHKRFWLAKQVMLCAMNFMLAAEACRLGYGADGRLRRRALAPRARPASFMGADSCGPRRLRQARPGKEDPAAAGACHALALAGCRTWKSEWNLSWKPPVQRGQPPDILLKSALRAEKRLERYFAREFQPLKGRAAYIISGANRRSVAPPAPSGL